MSRWESDSNFFKFADEEPPAEPNPKQACACGENDVGCTCTIGKTVSLKELWHKSFDAQPINTKARLDPETQRLVNAVDKTFRSQVLAVAKRIRKASRLDEGLVREIGELLAKNRWRREVVEAMAPFIQSKIDAGMLQGMEALAKVDPRAAQAVSRDDLKAYARSETVRLARQIGNTVTTTSEVRIRDLMQNGLAEGISNDALADRVEEWAVGKEDELEFTRSRAITIARTESARAQSLAKAKTWELTGLVQGKKWLLAPDACPFCIEAAAFFDEGQDVSKPFFSVGDVLELKDGSRMIIDYADVQAPPLHPNCRCDMIPVVDDDYEEMFSDMRAESQARREAYMEQLRNEQRKQ